jgi:hypothetical protein
MAAQDTTVNLDTTQQELDPRALDMDFNDGKTQISDVVRRSPPGLARASKLEELDGGKF